MNSGAAWIGGREWQTRWVKGHVDAADSGRDPHSFSVAERLNIIADELAGGASEAETSQPATQQDGSRTSPGGEWIIAATTQPRAYWDGVAKLLTQQGQQQAAAAYWAQRQRQRQVEHPTAEVASVGHASHWGVHRQGVSS